MANFIFHLLQSSYLRHLNYLIFVILIILSSLSQSSHLRHLNHFIFAISTISLYAVQPSNLAPNLPIWLMMLILTGGATLLSRLQKKMAPKNGEIRSEER